MYDTKNRFGNYVIFLYFFGCFFDAGADAGADGGYLQKVHGEDVEVVEVVEDVEDVGVRGVGGGGGEGRNYYLMRKKISGKFLK